MSTTLDDYLQPLPGGIDLDPQETILDHYGWRTYGPQDDKDAVIWARIIDPSVIPHSAKRFLPRGRVFSMLANGNMIPGIRSTDICPVMGMLIGSNSNSGDVVGYQYGDPATVETGNSLFKDKYNASFNSMQAGYVFETTEFDPEETTLLVPGTLLTTTVDEIHNFDIAGRLKVARPYVDTIIGVVTQGPAPTNIDHSKIGIWVQGITFPRFDRDLLRTLLS